MGRALRADAATRNPEGHQQDNEWGNTRNSLEWAGKTAPRGVKTSEPRPEGEKEATYKDPRDQHSQQRKRRAKALARRFVEHVEGIMRRRAWLGYRKHRAQYEMTNWESLAGARSHQAPWQGV